MAQKKQKWFAQPLPREVRFVTALQLTAAKYLSSKTNTHRVLMYLMENTETKISDEQYNAVNCYRASNQRINIIKDFFLETFNNEEAMIAYLNKEISIRYYKKNRKPGDVGVETAVKNIVNENLGELLNFSV